MKRKILLGGFFTIVCGLVAFGAARPQKQSTTGQTLPESWRGTWEVTVEYRNRETGGLVATEVTTAEICANESVLPALLDTRINCSVVADAGELGIVCRAKHSPQPGCNVFVEAGLESQRDGDMWNGTGSWKAKVVGECEHQNFGEDIVVKGRRLSSEAVCGGPPRNLIQEFFAHGALVSVLKGGN
jgi:hypothetical protein